MYYTIIKNRPSVSQQRNKAKYTFYDCEIFLFRIQKNVTHLASLGSRRKGAAHKVLILLLSCYKSFVNYNPVYIMVLRHDIKQTNGFDRS